MSEDEKNRWNIIKPMVTTDERINDLKEKLKREPDNPDYIRDLALLLLKQRRFGELLELYKKVVNLGYKELEIEILKLVIQDLKEKPKNEVAKAKDMEALKERPVVDTAQAKELKDETKETMVFLIPCRKGYKWGFCDRNKNLIIKPIYDDAYPFFEGLATVWLNGKCGFIDKKGSIIIQPKYYSASSFSEGLAPVRLNGKWGFIDKKGNFILQPVYDLAGRFSEGLAEVELNDKWGYIDKKGNFVIQPVYDNALPFFEGLARVELKRLQPGSYSRYRSGYIDTKGTQYWED